MPSDIMGVNLTGMPQEEQPDPTLAKGTDVEQKTKKQKKIIKDDDVNFDEDPNIVNLSEEEEKKLIEEMCYQLGQVISDRAELDSKIQGWNNIYDQAKDSKSFPWENSSNIHIPYPATVVDTTVSRLRRSIFGVKPVVMVLPREASDQPKTEKMQKFVDYLMDEVTDFEYVMDMASFPMCIDGTVIIKNMWLREEETVCGVERYDNLESFLMDFPGAQKKYPMFVQRLKAGKPVDVMVEYEQETYNAPKPEVVDILNFYASDKMDLAKSKFMAERIERSYDYLKDKEKRKIYHNVDLLLDEKDKIDNDPSKDTEKKYKKYELWQSIWNLDLKKDGKIRKYLITFSKEKKVILRCERFSYHHNKSPYIAFRILPRKNSWMGISLIEIIEDPSALIDTIFNQAVDANTLSIAQMFKARLGGSFNPKIHKVKPGGVWYLRNMDDVQEFKISGINPQTFTLFGEVFRIMEQRTGVTVLNLGIESPVDPRAPGNKVMALLNESVIRIEDFINRVRLPVAEVVRQWIALYYQFMPEGLEFRILNSEDGILAWDKIEKGDLILNPDIIVQTQTPAFNKEIEMKRHLEIYNIVRTEPMLKDSNPEGLRMILLDLFKLAGYQKANLLVPTQQQSDEAFAKKMDMYIAMKKQEQMKQQQEMGEMGIPIDQGQGMPQGMPQDMSQGIPAGMLQQG